MTKRSNLFRLKVTQGHSSWTRRGGLFTGGSGATDSTDMSYATPVEFRLKNEEAGFHKPNIYVGQQAGTTQR